MLVLSRKVPEQITLLDSTGAVLAQIKVCGVTGTRVRLGFEASLDVRIVRTESLGKDGFHEETGH